MLFLSILHFSIFLEEASVHRLRLSLSIHVLFNSSKLFSILFCQHTLTLYVIRYVIRYRWLSSWSLALLFHFTELIFFVSSFSLHSWPNNVSSFISINFIRDFTSRFHLDFSIPIRYLLCSFTIFQRDAIFADVILVACLSGIVQPLLHIILSVGVKI